MLPTKEQIRSKKTNSTWQKSFVLFAYHLRYTATITIWDTICFKPQGNIAVISIYLNVFRFYTTSLVFTIICSRPSLLLSISICSGFLYNHFFYNCLYKTLGSRFLFFFSQRKSMAPRLFQHLWLPFSYSLVLLMRKQCTRSYNRKSNKWQNIGEIINSNSDAAE